MAKQAHTLVYDMLKVIPSSDVAEALGSCGVITEIKHDIQHNMEHFTDNQVSYLSSTY